MLKIHVGSLEGQIRNPSSSGTELYSRVLDKTALF